MLSLPLLVSRVSVNEALWGRTRRHPLVSRGLLGSVAVLEAIVLAGCGGGGGGSSASSSKQAIAKQHAIATARLNRATLAVAGLARYVTRAPGRDWVHASLSCSRY